MTYLKKNKTTVIAIFIFLIILLVAIQTRKIFTSNEEKALYGNRLSEKKDNQISNNTEDQITAALKDEVEKVNIRESGRIFNVIITAKEDATLESAKALTNKIVEQLKENQLSYYDIQVFIKKTSDATDFPIIGYKQHTRDNFTWTKDRTGTEE